MNTKKAKKLIASYIKRNKIILNYPNVESFDNRVNLHYYFAEANSKKMNLGDYLSKVVVDWMLEKRGLSLCTPVKGKKHLYAIGSIVLMGYQNCTVWGTGFPFVPSALRGIPHRYPLRKMDIRSVRGPLSLEIMRKLGQNCPPVFGDPAILMPFLYAPEPTNNKTDYVVIPHFSTEQAARQSVGNDRVISMHTNDYQTVIDGICGAKRVISSSLHGIILAESYGVPAVFYQDRPDAFNFKYDDWYQSTGRTMKVYRNISDAIEAEPCPLPDLHKMQQELMDAFPYDLWND